MFDGLKNQEESQKNVGSDLKAIGDALSGLENGKDTAPERADRIGPERIQGSVYAWETERDDYSTVKNLLRQTRDAYQDRTSEEEFRTAYREVVLKLQKEGKINGKYVNRTFQSKL